MKTWKYRLAGIACAVALTACGGGGGSNAQPGALDANAGVQVQTADPMVNGDPASVPAGGATAPAPAPVDAAPATGSGGESAPATRPDVMLASMDEISAWNAACTTDECRITLPARSGRSLTWWGTDPRLVEQVNETCGPQPDCRVPDGDLLVWNFDCSPQPTCRIRLSRAY